MTSPPRRDPASRVIRTNPGLEFAKIGASRFDLSDPYHLALTVRWPLFVAGLFGSYLVITGVFAALYLAQPGCVSHTHLGSAASVSDALFFSIETLATVGYGVMAPATLYGHLVASAEIITGMAFTAIMTGLIFVRFSKPRAKIVYADTVVICRHNGNPTLMLRIGNARTSVLTQLHVSLSALIRETTLEGGSFTSLHELPLLRASWPTFPLITTMMHVIDEHSPLAGLDRRGLDLSKIRLVFSLEARDPELAAMVYDITSYDAAAIRPGMRFADAVSQHQKGHTVADLTRISLIEPEDTPQLT
jgi:inward rectifier potassium channel